jgi:hypothetical protein
MSIITINMSKAREIHRDRLRRMRVPKLAALDVASIRAMETNDTARLAEIAKQKQTLRDVTADPRIDAAATPEALSAVIPNSLT